MKHEFFQKKSLAYDSLVQKVKDKYEESLDGMLVKLINELIPVVNELTSEVERRTLGDETVKLPLLNLDNKVESLVAVREICYSIQQRCATLFPSDEFEQLTLYWKKILTGEQVGAIKAKISIPLFNSQAELTDLSNILKFLILHLTCGQGISDEKSLNEMKVIKDHIFQVVSAAITVPALTDFFREIKGLNPNEVNKSDLALATLQIVGYYRHEIAEYVNDPNADEMGVLACEGDWMRDPVFLNPSWKPWDMLMNEKIKGHLGGDHLLPGATITMLEKLTFSQLEQFNGTYGVYHQDGDNVEIKKNTKSACYHFSVSQDGENVKAICVHKPFNEQEYYKLGELILAVLESDGETALYSALKPLLYDLSHDTLLVRGQSASEKSIAEALSIVHNFHFKFIPEWMLPNLNYDQQILAIVSQQEWENSILGCTLTPIDQD